MNNKKDFLILLSVIFSFIFVFCVTSCDVFAVYYDEPLPSWYNLTGGKVVVIHNNNYGDSVLLFDNSKLDYITLTSSGRLYNTTNTNIVGVMYTQNQSYQIRLYSLSDDLQWRQSASAGTYVSYPSYTITNLNWDIDTNDSVYRNDNYFFTRFEKFVISCLIVNCLFSLIGVIMNVGKSY